MRKPVVLITGAGGEIGSSLIHHFADRASNAADPSSEFEVLALDLRPIEPELEKRCTAALVGDILDKDLLNRLVSQYEIHEIYHLAALLSTRAEYSPQQAHHVNVEGTLNLLQLAHEQSRWHGNPVKFLFPSSIAAYGLPDRATKKLAGRVREDDFCVPTTMYGCNKLYCEHLGRYYTHHYQQLAADPSGSGVDFRALRFPGLISAFTEPSGGTSDFAPEMVHAAARGESYPCFVEEDAAIPFMAMPDGVKALVDLAAAESKDLSRRVYNVSAFSLTAADIRDRVLRAFPEADITFQPDPPRANIVASWPEDTDDSPARNDWGWNPEYGADRAFDEYLVPHISKLYRG